jgi:4'-phosphopantetheinyl transferase EntD
MIAETTAFSDAWGSLLPAGVQIQAGKLSADVIQLTRAELASMGEMGAERKREFENGRTYAKRALAAFGAQHVELPIGCDRAPLWPKGFVGSITHVRKGFDGYCAVAVARSDDYSAIGIDVEYATGLAPAVWSTVLTAAELEQIYGLPAPERESDVIRRWCVKEATVKASRLNSHPLCFETKRCQDNHDRFLLVHVSGAPLPWEARTAFLNGLILAAVAVAVR